MAFLRNLSGVQYASKIYALPSCTPQCSTELDVVCGLVRTFVISMLHLLRQLSITSCLSKFVLVLQFCKNSHVSIKQSNTEHVEFVSIGTQGKFGCKRDKLV